MENNDFLNDTYDDDSFTQSPTYYDYGLPVVATLSLLLVVSMVMAFFGNVMVIMTILKHRGMRTRTNMLLGNLAVADILVAVVDMPVALATIVNHDWIFPEAYCVLNGFFVGLGLMLSVHTLMWISIHKFISITGPINRNVTQRQILLVMVLSWVWTIFYNLTATPLIGMTKTVYKKGSSQCGPVVPGEMSQYIHSGVNTLVNLVIPMVVMFYCYYKIFKEVKDHLESMRNVGMRCDSLIQQRQIAVTLFIVLVVFFMCWLPYIIYSMSLVFCGEKCIHPIANPISYLSGYMNSACNPVIYALRSPSFRGSFKDIICRTSSRIPGSIRTSQGVGGMVTSFRKSIMRSTQKTNLKQQGSVSRPVRVPKKSVVVCNTIVYSKVNGEPRGMEVTKADCESECETGLPTVHFKSDSHLESVLPSHAIDFKLYYDPWKPLQPQVPNNHLSKSCQEITTSTAATMTRSVSTGAISQLPSATKETQEDDITSKRRHKSEVHRPLMWQASVDHLSVLPVGRKRRHTDENGRPLQQQQQQQQVEGPLQRHLRVRRLINTVRKSLGDLFTIPEH